MKRCLIVFTLVVVGTVMTTPAGAHCEIPCGIYDDPMRVSLLKEHADTIEKSIKMIVELSAATDKDYNQLIRWVDNKETHSGYIQDIVTQYFLTQRVKAVEPGETAAYKAYVKQVTVLHQILVSAMKTKQSTDLRNVEILRALIDEFAGSYFYPDDKKAGPAKAPAAP